MTRELTPDDFIRTPVVPDAEHKPSMRATPRTVVATLPADPREAAAPGETPAVTS